MEYFKINGIDFSNYVNELKVNKVTNHTAQTNAAGNTVVDKINTKYIVTVGFIYMNETEMTELVTELDWFTITVFFKCPKTGVVKQIKTIVPEYEVEYYTIQDNKILYKPLTLEFVEL